MCTVLLVVNIPTKIYVRFTLFHRGHSAITDEGWSSDLSPLSDAFSPKWTMALLSESHNGVHCCGTVGDSHSSSQLSTAKCTFTGDSFQNHDAKVRISEQNTKFYLRIFCRSATRSSSARLLPAGRKKKTHSLQAKRRKRRAERSDHIISND